MHFSFFTSLLFLSLLARSSSARMRSRQAPNNVYPGREQYMTATINCSVIIVKVERSLATSLLPAGYQLLPPTGFPDGFLEPSQHVLYYLAGYLFDIRQGPAKVPQLSAFDAYVPFVDVLRDGKTPFAYNPVSYLGDLVPALVADLTAGTNNQLATFDPPHAAYKSVGSRDFSFAVSQELLTGIPLVGVGLSSPRFQYTMSRSKTSKIPASTFRAIANQPILNANLLLGPMCGQTSFWFNQTYSDPFFSAGDVQVFPPVLPSTTTFEGHGYVGSVAWITRSASGDCRAYARP